MISLYRAILCDHAGEDSIDWYQKATLIRGSGATMQLVRAMIRTAAAQAHPESHFPEEARNSIAVLRAEFGGAEEANEIMDELTRILDSPQPVPAVQVLRLLPFNYH